MSSSLLSGWWDTRALGVAAAGAMAGAEEAGRVAPALVWVMGYGCLFECSTPSLL